MRACSEQKPRFTPGRRGCFSSVLQALLGAAERVRFGHARKRGELRVINSKNSQTFAPKKTYTAALITGRSYLS